MIKEDPLEYMYCLLISCTQLREVGLDFSVVYYHILQVNIHNYVYLYDKQIKLCILCRQ